ncbi:MAG TPA: ribonuclease R, partial [Lachnospiraceae bacterium]|nr:ribonuclease R [Lachnospiraceae bacterium]
MKSLEERKKLILRLMGEKSYKPMKEKELAILLEVKSEDREYLKEALNALLSEGTAVITKRGRYMLPEIRNITGIYRSTRHGYGFLELKDADEEDYFIEEGASMNAFDGDTVEAKPVNYGTSRGGRHKSAEICAVIKRAHETLVGTYDKSANRYGFVKPDNSRINRDIFIPLERSLNALDGQKVVCEIIDYGTERQSPEGRITEILGYVDEPGVDILSVIRGFDLPAEFPERVLNQANRVPDAVSESDLRGRRDLRGLLTVTIDGEDSKDLDDAVSLEMSGDDYLLGVHIADVANYVQEDSALDREALKRGTSVYLCDRVLPMLPQRLSNGICSLNENEDRLTLSCIMRINRNGEVTDHEIVESVIRTRRRMTYTVVNELILKNDPLHGICEEVAGDKELVRMLSDMAELASILREKRKKRGSIDFGMPETKIELDENGYPTRIAPYDRNAATKLIEEFMLAANETVAEHYYWLKYPFVYRTHADPSADKMRSLAAFISKLGYGLHIKGDEIHPKELQKLLVKCEDTPEENLISRLTLRSM